MSAALRRLALPAFFALTMGLAGPLWAAGNVSNLNLSASQGEIISNDFPSALSFTTGSNSGGYTLQSVTLKLAESSPGTGTAEVALYSVSGENPGTSQKTLTAPSSVSGSTFKDYVFSCTGNGCSLSSGTSYYIVVTPPRSASYYWAQNTSGTETNTPSDAGWSIADDAKYRDGAGGSWLSEGAVKLMKVTWAAAGTVSLSASSVEATSATLSIANHSGNWYHKYTTPSGGQCSSAVTGTSTSVTLTSGTSYTFKAYSDSSCTSANELDSVDLLTKPGKASGLSTTVGNASLDVSWTATTGAASYKIQWKSGADRYDETNRQTTSTSTSKTLTNLTNNTAYTIRVAAVNATGDGAWSDEATGTPAAPTLTASSVEATSATLTIANHSGNWYHKYTTPSGGQCSSAVTGTSTSVTLTSGTSYTFKAYSDSNCTSELDSVDLLTKPGKVAGVSATAGNTSLAVSWTATTGAASYKIQWKSGTQEYDATNRQTTSTTASKTLSTLVNGTAYTIRVAAVNATGDGAWSDDATGTPAAPSPSMTATNVEATTATLNFAHHGVSWSYKRTLPTTGSCVGPVVSATENLTGLTPGTTYSYTSYGSTSICVPSLTGGDTVSFTTKPAKVAGVSASAGNTSLAVSWTAVTGATSYKVQWKSGAQDWDATNRQTTSTTAAKTLSTLTNGTAYTIRVAAVNATGDGAWSDEATGTPAAPALTAGNVTATGARLTLANHTGTWYVKRTAPTAALGCQPVTNSTFINVVETGNGATYTYTAYSDACTTVLDTVTFTTLNLTTSSVTQTTAVLSLANHSSGWYYKRTSPADPACTAVASGGTGSLSVLTASTSYTYQAYSDSSCSTSIASHSFSTLGAVDLWIENITRSGAYLTLRNYTGGAWSYKIDPAGRGRSCYTVPARVGAVAQINHLPESTQHTVSAYHGADCDANNLWDSETFTTLAWDAQVPTLSVSAVGNTTATLNLANHTGDWWYKNDAVAGGCTKVDSGTYTATLSNLTANTPYKYNAYSNAGCDNPTAPVTWWSGVSFNTTGPISATITDHTDTQVTLAISGIDDGKWSYKYYNKTTLVVSKCKSYDASTVSVIVWGLTSGTPYTFYVYRGDSCSYPDRLTLNAHTISLSAGLVGPSSATLTLEHHEGTWSYRAGGASGQASGGAQANGGGASAASSNAGQCQSVPSGTYTAQLTGLDANTSYTYTAYAGGNCAGTALGQAQFTTGAAAPTGPPGTPASVTVTRSDGALNAAWPAVDGATSYHVTYTSDNGTSWSLAAENHSTNSIDITGVDNSLTYIVGVRARNGHGDSDWTNSSPADPLPGYAPPDTPSSVTVTRGDGVLNASWPAVDNATSYHITYTSDNGTSWSLAAEHHAGTSITISGVDNALTYIVGARARNEHGDSGWTNSPSVGPFTPEPPEPTDPPAPTEPPGTPSSVTVTRGDGTLHASWPAVPGASSYHVTYSGDNGTSWSLAAFSHPDTSITISGVDNALSYIVGVRARNAQGGSGWRNSPSAAPHTGKGGASITLGGEPPGGAPTKTNLAPAFDTGATLPDLSYEQGARIAPLTLPAATGGDGVLSYALQPALPQGMSFDKTTRVLSGTPETRMKAARYTYTATDADGDTASLYFRLAAVPSARARAEQSVLTDGLASQGRAVLGGARRALDGRFRDADRAIDLSVLRANWSSWQDRLTAAAKGPSGNNTPGWGRTSSPSPEASGETGIDAAAATPGWGQTSSLSPETSGSAGDASLTPLPGVFGLSGLSGTCGTAALQETPWPDASDSRVDNGWDDGACNGAASVRLSDWLWGRRYALRLNGIFGNADDEARSGPDWTLWSAGDQRRIEGTPGNNRYETDWRAMHLGLDARFNSDWLAGVVVSRGWGETGYGYEASGISGTGKTGYGHAAQGSSGTGELDTDVWTALPYLHGRLGGFEVWGLAGGGWGEISATRSEGDGIKEDSNLNLWLGAVGASKPLLGLGPLSLSFVADAGLTHMTTGKGDGNSALDGLKATTRQMRLGLAGEYEASLFDGQAELTPFWQLSGRYDGGDGLAGAGLEAQAGLRYRSARLSLVAQGHWLGMHSETGYKEYGASMEARVSPLAHGRGLTLALTPRWGADGALSGASSGMGTANSATGIGAMWDTDIVRRAAIANTQAAGDDTAHVWSVDAELGYGLWLPHQLGLLTPFSEMRLAGGHEQRQRLGLRLDAVGGQGLQLELSGFRASTHLETDTGVNLNATLNY